MNASSVIHSDSGIGLPYYAEANDNQDLEAAKHSRRKSVCRKLRLVSIWILGVLVILVLCGVIGYKIYIQYLRSGVRKS